MLGHRCSLAAAALAAASLVPSTWSAGCASDGQGPPWQAKADAGAGEDAAPDQGGSSRQDLDFPADTGQVTDAAARDLGAPSDVAPRPDAAPPLDLAVPADAATPEDLGVPGDAVPPTDLTVLPDAAPPADLAAPDDAAAPDDLAAPDDQGPPWEGYPWEPQSVCGMAPYRWHPPQEVAEPTHWVEDPAFRLTPALIEQLLGLAGYGGLVVPSHGTRIFLFRYTTQDRGEIVEATGLVGVPDLELAPGGLAELPTVLVLHPTSGYANRCAPSRGLEGRAAAMLPASQGYIAVAPDLLGLCGIDPCPAASPHPYLVGEPTALAALDAVRAAHTALATRAGELGIVPDGRLLPWGPSQGGHAALFVDRYAPHYAPELELACTVAVVPPADLAGAAELALTSFGQATGLGTAFLAGAYFWYAPDRPADVFRSDGPRDYATHVIETYPNTCSAGDLLEGARSIEDAFAPDLLEALRQGELAALDPWGCYVLENSLPTSSVPRVGDRPVLMILGERDEVVNPAAQRRAAETLCEQGYRLELIECANQDHYHAVIASVDRQLDWMADCLAGEQVPAERICAIGPAVQCR